MTVKAATETKLGELHAKVATVMTNALDVVEKAQIGYLDADADDVGPMPEVSAPLLGVITKFLSDNKISCLIEESDAVGGLAATLAERRKNRRTVGNVVHITDNE